MKKIWSIIICFAMLFSYLPTGWAEEAVVSGDADSVLPQTPAAYAASDYVLKAARIAVGTYHTAVVMQDGTVETWGDNSYGQLEVPAGLKDVKAVAASGRHTLALKADGTLVAWGDNSSGYCDIPAELDGVKVKAIDASAALTENGSVVLWGGREEMCTVPDSLSGKVVAAISVGSNHVLVLTEDREVIAWGSNYYQQCDVPEGLNGHVVAIVAGNCSSFALKDDGTVTAWGRNSSGECEVPEDLDHVAALSNGPRALKADGTVVVWGSSNRYGQQDIPTGLDHVEVLATENGACYAVQEDGTLAAWGNNRYGQCDIPEGLNLASTVGINNKLCGLEIAGCDLYPAFSSTEPEYVVDVAPDVETVTLTAQLYSSKAQLVVNGEAATAGTPVVISNLEAGDNPTAIKVTSEYGSERTYTVHIKRVSADYTLPQTPAAYQASDNAQYARRLATGSQHSLVIKKDGTVVAWGNGSDGRCNMPLGLNQVTAVAAGGNHSLALKEDGTVVAWGNNSQGQCDVPAGLSDVVDIVAAGRMSAALNKDGKIVIWGEDNYNLQAGMPEDLQGESSDVVDIACSGSHMLALKVDGTVAAWGYNSGAQCDVPAGLNHVVAIAAGHYHSMALKADGTLVTWGKISYGSDDFELPAPLHYVRAIATGNHHGAALKWDGSLVVWGEDEDLNVISERDDILAVSSDYDHLLALHGDGTVTAWGDNSNGPCDVQQGLNLFAHEVPYMGLGPDIPQTPSEYADSDYAKIASKIVTGSVCLGVLNGDGTVKAWGLNNFGQCNVPADLNHVVVLSACGYNMMALKEDGTVVVWEDNIFDQCNVPEDLSHVTKVAAGLQFCLALKEDGTVAAWGHNDKGQCDVPRDLSGVTAISAGNYHNLAIKVDGTDSTVVAWGSNDEGQCDVPEGLNHVATIYAGFNYSLALKEDGTVAAWGNNDKGQCDVPQDLHDVVDISVDGGSWAALKANGTVVVCGSNYMGIRNVPVGLHDVVAIASGGAVLALKADGTVTAWGANFGGQLDEVRREENVRAVFKEGENSVLVQADGTVKVFGNNSRGQCDVPDGINLLGGHYFTIDDVKLLDSLGNEITAVSGQGGYRIETQLKSQHFSPQNALVIIQVRSGTGAGAISGGQVLSCIGLERQIAVDGDVIAADFTLPSNLNGTAYVDVFVWDGWDTMVPRAASNQSLSFTVTE